MQILRDALAGGDVVKRQLMADCCVQHATRGNCFVQFGDDGSRQAIALVGVNRGILDHATVRTPLLPLPDGAEAEIADAFAAANIGKVAVPA